MRAREARAITVCVGYDDLLELTLPRFAFHFHSVLVVTSPEDARTLSLAGRFGNVRTYETDAFRRDGASFNKGLAMEEGFSAMGREGWICILDADIRLPARMDLGACEPGRLYTPTRRMCVDVAVWDASEDWSAFPRKQDDELPGYFQLFHASDPAIHRRPWYDTGWRHAAGCDSVFEKRWPRDRKVWLDFDVLHLGPDGTNWWGRQTQRLDGSVPAGADESRRLMAEMRTRRKRGITAWEMIHRQA